MELDAPARTTQDYEGPDMRSNIEVILETPIDQPDLEVTPSGPPVELVIDEALPEKEPAKKSRPRTAGRHRKKV